LRKYWKSVANRARSAGVVAVAIRAFAMLAMPKSLM